LVVNSAVKCYENNSFSTKTLFSAIKGKRDEKILHRSDNPDAPATGDWGFVFLSVGKAHGRSGAGFYSYPEIWRLFSR
jgi:hypothetical protein